MSIKLPIHETLLPQRNPPCFIDLPSSSSANTSPKSSVVSLPASSIAYPTNTPGQGILAFLSREAFESRMNVYSTREEGEPVQALVSCSRDLGVGELEFSTGLVALGNAIQASLALTTTDPERRVALLPARFAKRLSVVEDHEYFPKPSSLPSSTIGKVDEIGEEEDDDVPLAQLMQSTMPRGQRDSIFSQNSKRSSVVSLAKLSRATPRERVRFSADTFAEQEARHARERQEYEHRQAEMIANRQRIEREAKRAEAERKAKEEQYREEIAATRERREAARRGGFGSSAGVIIDRSSKFGDGSIDKRGVAQENLGSGASGSRGDAPSYHTHHRTVSPSTTQSGSIDTPTSSRPGTGNSSSRSDSSRTLSSYATKGSSNPSRPGDFTKRQSISASSIDLSHRSSIVGSGSRSSLHQFNKQYAPPFPPASIPLAHRPTSQYSLSSKRSSASQYSLHQSSLLPVIPSSYDISHNLRKSRSSNSRLSGQFDPRQPLPPFIGGQPGSPW